MGERTYITPDDYDFAAANGVSAANLRQRVEIYGWSIERATFTPVRQASHNYGWEERKEIAALCGVKYGTYRRRVLEGMDPDEAATKKVNREYKKHPLWVKWEGTANQHGVKKATFFRRVQKFGWEHEKAAITPPYDNMRKGLTVDHFQEAAQNGISAVRVRQRIKQGWNLERAISEPVHRSVKNHEHELSGPGTF